MSSLRRCLLAAILLAVGLLVVVTPSRLLSQTAYVYGCDDWLASGDHWQFLGDCGLNSVFDFEPCAAWASDSCSTDKGFAFRQIADVDPGNCDAYEEADPETCYVIVVVCCFWFDDGGAGTDLCDEKPGYKCWEAEEDCGANDYCGTIWEVGGFNTGQGDETSGCWELNFVCDPGEACVNSTSSCAVVRKWMQDCPL